MNPRRWCILGFAGSYLLALLGGAPIWAVSLTSAVCFFVAAVAKLNKETEREFGWTTEN